METCLLACECPTVRQNIRDILDDVEISDIAEIDSTRKLQLLLKIENFKLLITDFIYNFQLIKKKAPNTRLISLRELPGADFYFSSSNYGELRNYLESQRENSESSCNYIQIQGVAKFIENYQQNH